MIAANTNFDCVLDQVLACRTDPAVPVDLARRIVVRTASLPQFTSIPEVEAASPSPPNARAQRQLRPIWLGAALAASFAAFTICSNLLVASPSNQLDRVSAPDQPSPQLAMKADSLLASPASRADLRSPQDLQVSPHAHVGHTTSTVDPGLGDRRSLADAHNAVKGAVVPASFLDGRGNTDSLASNAQDLHLDGAFAPAHPGGANQAESFSLAANDQPSARVYGPVLDSETGQEHAVTISPISEAGTAFGFAGSNRAGGAAFLQGR